MMMMMGGLSRKRLRSALVDKYAITSYLNWSQLIVQYESLVA